MNKLQQLQQLYQNHGNFRICKYKHKWVSYLEATIKQKEFADLRELTKSEICLDFESKKEGLSAVEYLKTMQVSFSAWDTGSRGIHCHLFFPEMLEPSWTTVQVKRAREWWIKRFNCDLSKKSGVIALEKHPHFKTGNVKTLIVSVDKGINVLPRKCLNYAKNFKSNPAIMINSRRGVERCKLINLAMYVTLKRDTGRGDVLCRNAAVLFNSKLDDKEAKEMMRLLISAQRTGSLSWLDWARNNKKIDFSCGELRRWLRNTDQLKLEQLTCWRCSWK